MVFKRDQDGNKIAIKERFAFSNEGYESDSKSKFPLWLLILIIVVLLLGAVFGIWYYYKK